MLFVSRSIFPPTIVSDNKNKVSSFFAVGRPFKFEFIRKGEYFSVLINGRAVAKPIKYNAEKLGRIGFWSNNDATMRIHDVTLIGKLVDP